MKFSKQKNKRINIQLTLESPKRKPLIITKNYTQPTQQISNLQFKNNNHQQKQNLIPAFNSPISHNKSKFNIIKRPQIQSLNISKKIIQGQQNQNDFLQFSKNKKNRLKPQHKRTQSNGYYHQQNNFHFNINKYSNKNDNKNDNISNFSNSLQNISRQIIQIPFAKKIIIPHKRQQTKLINYQKNNKPLQFKRNSSFQKNKKGQSNQKKYKSPEIKIIRPSHDNKDNNSRQNCKSIYSFITKYKKMQNNQMENMTKLSDFVLKPKKITQNGSIIYLALHKKLNMIFSLKSIRKCTILPRYNAFLAQLKIGYLSANANLVKIYTFFSDQHNFYILKEYLDEDHILSQQQRTNQTSLSSTINQIMIGYIHLINKYDIGWMIKPHNIIKSHGICKISSYKYNLKAKNNEILPFKKLLTYLVDNNSNDQIKLKGIQTTESILFMSGLASTSTSARKFTNQFNSFKFLIQNQSVFQKSNIMKVWNHAFLENYRRTSFEDL